MKSTIYSYTVLIVFVAMAAACTPEKTAKLEQLKKKQEQLAKEIAELEKEIGKSKDSVEVKMKDVAVTELKARKFDHYIQTQGYIEAEDNILVSAKSMGVITQVLVKEGQTVSKGQVLAQIDNSYILRNIEAMKSQLELAVSVYERQKNLWDQKIGTEVQFLQSKTNKESLEKQLAALHEQNDMTRIKSPINGVVDMVSMKVGENIAPGQPAARVINTSRLKVKADVSEAHVSHVKKGDKVLITIPDLKKEMEAKVSFVGTNINTMSRTFEIEADLSSGAGLRPNMTALIRIIYESATAVIVVPVNAIQDINNEKVVYVSEPSGSNTIARKKVVTIQGIFDGQAQVTGLNAGESVVTTGFQGLNDGQFIKIQ
ncbi:MAG: efflux RND transporter periplasmic adaptor subunit [Cyclobacteriaceae bacterium]|nr:efflux RND transporter periplasmic adaptor subunit [Cyclobacteriaceae bacterium]